LSFEGRAGQRIALGIGNSPIQAGRVSLVTPDDQTRLWDFVPVSGNSDFIDPVELSVDGTYQVGINMDAWQTTTGPMDVTLYEVPADFASTISMSQTVGVPLGTPGQNGRLTFQGSAGQQVTVRPSTSMPGLNWTYVLQPDGGKIASHYNSNQFSATLPVAWIYTILVDPAGLNVGSMSVTLTSP